MLFDLDPPDGGFTLAIRVAHLIREELERLELESYVKTSGADGIHVLVPIARRATYEQTYEFAELVARGLEEQHPGLVTTEWLKHKREGVLVDHRQNARGKTIASVYSVRPKPGAPVSTPLRWDELTEKVTPRRFGMREALERVGRIHVLVPITRRATFEQTYEFAELVARALEERHPGLVTTEWLKHKREGVLVDHRQNARGKTIASVYSVRPKPGAPVSTPLRWDELTEDVTAAPLWDTRGARAGRKARRPLRARARGRPGTRAGPEEAALARAEAHPSSRCKYAVTECDALNGVLCGSRRRAGADERGAVASASLERHRTRTSFGRVLEHRPVRPPHAAKPAAVVHVVVTAEEIGRVAVFADLEPAERERLVPGGGGYHARARRVRRERG